jgi:hypothetical protein
MATVLQASAEPAASTETKQPINLAAELRKAFRRQWEDSGQVQLGALRDWFLDLTLNSAAGQNALRAQMLDAFFDRTVQDEARRTRQESPDQAPVPTANGIAKRTAAIVDAVQRGVSFAFSLESLRHGVLKSVREMTPEECLEVAALRKAPAVTSLGRVLALQRLAERGTPGKPIRESLDDVQIETIYREADAEVRRQHGC